MCLFEVMTFELFFYHYISAKIALFILIFQISDKPCQIGMFSDNRLTLFQPKVFGGIKENFYIF